MSQATRARISRMMKQRWAEKKTEAGKRPRNFRLPTIRPERRRNDQPSTVDTLSCNQTPRELTSIDRPEALWTRAAYMQLTSLRTTTQYFFNPPFR